jgi:acyl-CoA synthetase (AMP-forming)/AMP-acid ligase II
MPRRSAAPKPGSVGVTLPGTECRIVDPVTRADLGRRGGGRALGAGAAGDEGLSQQPGGDGGLPRAEGWLRTGDIALFDAEGYLFIRDRLKELIKVKGFQVAPAELEAVLLAHPEVADAAVVGVPDEEAGEVPAAFVVGHGLPA